MNKEEIIYSALEAMKEQDALLNHQQSHTPKIIMSIETYEQMQRDPEVAKNICNRIGSKSIINDAIDYLKKW